MSKLQAPTTLIPLTLLLLMLPMLLMLVMLVMLLTLADAADAADVAAGDPALAGANAPSLDPNPDHAPDS